MTPVLEQGNDNRTFRLGEELAVRVPSAEGYVAGVAKEDLFLPVIARYLSTDVPVPVATGVPSEEYPYPWSVRRWITRTKADRDSDLDREALAKDLGGFLRELRAVPSGEGPAAGAHSFYRGTHPSVSCDQVQQALGQLADQVDVEACHTIWNEAARTAWPTDPVWFHGDVAPGNLLTDRGRLIAVIDFGTCGVGDPACDLVIAWTLFTDAERGIFRESAALPDDAWARGRGWALWKALVTLCHPASNLYSHQAHALAELVADYRNAWRLPRSHRSARDERSLRRTRQQRERPSLGARSAASSRQRIALRDRGPQRSEVVEHEPRGRTRGAVEVCGQMDRGRWGQGPGEDREGAGSHFAGGGCGGYNGPAEAGGDAAFDSFDTAEAGAAGVGLSGGEQAAGDVVAVAAAVLEEQGIVLGQLRPRQRLSVRIPAGSTCGGAEQDELLDAEGFQVHVGRGQLRLEQQGDLGGPGPYGGQRRSRARWRQADPHRRRDRPQLGDQSREPVGAQGLRGHQPHSPSRPAVPAGDLCRHPGFQVEQPFCERQESVTRLGRDRPRRKPVEQPHAKAPLKDLQVPGNG